ncbi:uncharacterized, partial [Tachysurus ichikawai]
MDSWRRKNTGLGRDDRPVTEQHSEEKLIKT